MRLDPDRIRRETVEEFLRVRGPGGQHRNKSETGVRLHHIPTGVIVTATESRSRARNRKVAWLRLLERLAALYARPKPRFPTRPSASSRRARLEEKKQRSRVKRSRRPPSRDE
ncbi:MAG: peptide chain release factor-like protein [Candidatus Eisenbacteria bacterium]|nr:peptide chain release factor-like protein [Candidatus Eisenbacteria bacterium]